jgi:nicotinamide-nucleotide adenylyltransferase
MIEESRKTVLFIGRFQPFHLGHLSVAMAILEKEDKMIVGIGSSEQHDEPGNPFTSDEREKMVREALFAKGISEERFEIIPVRDINDFDKWTAHVERLVPSFYKIYTGSEIVRELYEKDGRYEIEGVDFVDGVTGTSVRAKIVVDDMSWRSDVHSEVARLIDKFDGVGRIVGIQSRED